MLRTLVVLASLVVSLLAVACGGAEADIAKAIREAGGYESVEVLKIEQSYDNSWRSPDDKGTTYVVRAKVRTKDGQSREWHFQVFIAKQDGWSRVGRSGNIGPDPWDEDARQPGVPARSDAPAQPAPLEWTVVGDRSSLLAEIEAAKGKSAVVVQVWATWCTYCKRYDRVIDQSAILRPGFARLRRLRIDVTTDRQDSLREAVGVPRSVQPYMVFIDREGRIRRDLDVNRWFGADAEPELARRLEALGN